MDEQELDKAPDLAIRKALEQDARHIEVRMPKNIDKEKIEAFVDMCRPYGVKDVARTGMIAMPRHTRAVKSNSKENSK